MFRPGRGPGRGPAGFVRAFAAANKTSYWVGGSGNWSDATNHWANVSGGLPNAANLPDATTDAVFDASSNATAYTVTINASAVCRDLNFSTPPAVSGTVTLAGSSPLSIAGNMQLLAGMSGTGNTSTITFSSTLAGRTIAFNGASLGGAIVFDGVGGSWTLMDTLSLSATGTGSLTVTNGALFSNGQSLSVARFLSSGSATRTINLSGSAVTLTFSAAGTLWGLNATGLTWIAPASLTYTGTATGTIFSGGGLAYNAVSLSATGNAMSTMIGANSFTSLSITCSAANNNWFLIGANQTVSGALTLAGNSVTNRLFFATCNAAGTPTPGTAFSISAASVTASNTDFMDITGAGAAIPFSGTSLGDCLGNTNITFTPAVSRFWVATSGGSWSATSSWAATTGGASGVTVPLPQDTVTLDANSITSGGRTITIDIPRIGKNVTFATIANTPTVSNSQVTYNFGHLTLGSSMTAALASTHTLAGRSAQTLTSATVTLMGTNAGLNVQAPGGSYTLQDALTVGGTSTVGINLLLGTLDTNGFTVTCPGRVTITAGTLSMGASIIVLTGAGNTSPWLYVSGTIVPGASTVKFTDATATTKTFAGGGQTYNNIWFSGAGTGVFLLSGSNTFNDYKADANLVLQFTASTTTTAASYTIASGCSITSSTASNHTLAKTGGPNVKVNALTVSRSTATPGFTFYARNGSTDGGNNSGWNFYDPDYVLSAVAGAYVIAGSAASVRWGHRLAAVAGAYALAGQAASLLYGRRLTAAAGAYTFSGKTANLLKGYYLAAGAGSFAYAGKVASLLWGHRLTAAAGSYAIAGSVAAQRWNRILRAGAGAYLLAGSAANLIKMAPAQPLDTDQIWYLPSRSTRWNIAPRATTFVLPARGVSYKRRS